MRRQNWQRTTFLLIAAWVGGLSFLAIVLPSIFVKQHGSDEPTHLQHETVPRKELAHDNTVDVAIPVYRTKQQTIETVPLEQYVRGVVAAEMPIDFDVEALKAQAIAARTYIARRIQAGDFSDVPAGAWVSDTVQHQVYVNAQELRSRWGWFTYRHRMEKLTQAVVETRGQIITYEGEPIEAVFFSTSNGYTENSEDYWIGYVPYLRSVPSPWDEHISPRYETKLTFTIDEILQKLELSRSVTAAITTNLSPLEWSEGHRIKKIRIGDRTFTGREVREKLGLPSSQFQWKTTKTGIEIVSYGYGHGVGMSQYGAQGMALAGKTAAEIIQYYYQGVEIEQFQLDKV